MENFLIKERIKTPGKEGNIEDAVDFVFKKRPDVVDAIYNCLEFNFLSENKKRDLERFVKKDKRNIRAIEAINSWKNKNGVSYNPEEIFSRNEKIYSEIGRYKIKDFKNYLGKLLNTLDYLEKNNLPFEVSAYSGNPFKLKRTGIRFEINPEPEDVMWASPIDVASSRVQNASKDLSRYPISFTKAPKTKELEKITSNLADVIDNRGKKNNELAIIIKRGNFRLLYDEGVEQDMKDLIDKINSKIVYNEPVLNNNRLQPTNTSENNIIEFYNRIERVDASHIRDKYTKIYSIPNIEREKLAKKIYSKYLNFLFSRDKILAKNALHNINENDFKSFIESERDIT